MQFDGSLKRSGGLDLWQADEPSIEFPPCLLGNSSHNLLLRHAARNEQSLTTE